MADRVMHAAPDGVDALVCDVESKGSSDGEGHRRMRGSSGIPGRETALASVSDATTMRLASLLRVSSPNSVERADVGLALTYGLELLKRGAILVHSDTQPCFANRAALDILRKKDGISLSASGIQANNARDTKLLIALLREAIAYPAKGEPKESPMLVSRKVGAALVVRVVPGPELSEWVRSDARTALVTISDPGSTLEVKEQDLVRLYGLTRGEAAVASLVIRGKSIEEAADTLFISAHTARTHLKRIFMKTETHRQPELVVRLLTSIL